MILGLLILIVVGKRYDTSGGPKDGVLNVHVVPHTHDDVGWLKTVDQYYTGLNASTIQNAKVHMIINSVVTSLQKNPDRKFTYVEQAFFQRWWRDADEEDREICRNLVKNGQLVFTNGGWCMHDEATPHYLDMIDQTTLGHRWLKDEFDYTVTTGWQLDPFGHSATQASLLSAEMGFDGLFFGRIDYQDRQLRQQSKSCEFIWDGSPSLGSTSAIFSGLTGEYGGNYGAPSGFNWQSPDEMMQDNPNLNNYNVGPRVEDWVHAAVKLGNWTRGKHVMFTMGSDFNYDNAEQWFYNMDKIIHYANKDGRVNSFYSDPETYTKAKIEEVKSGAVTFPTKKGDFFPYADGPHMFWTGYFTSRPAVKRYIRDASGYYQTARQILTSGNPDAIAGEVFQKLGEALGVAQHHDAVSGTEKQHVAFDYSWRIARGWNDAKNAVSDTLKTITNNAEGFFECPLANVSECAFTGGLQQDSFSVVIWNALGQSVTQLVEIPIKQTGAQVMDLNTNKAIEAQVIPVLAQVDNYGASANALPHVLVFEASLPAAGFNTYTITLSNKASAPYETRLLGRHHKLKTGDFQLSFTDGYLSGIKNTKNNMDLTGKQSFFWYNASAGFDQPSGAYIFRPNSSHEFPVSDSKPTLSQVSGDVVTEFRQVFNEWITQRIRVHGNSLQVRYTVGGIPIDDGLGKEIISRWDFGPIKNAFNGGSEFYTDANGREMLQRRTDYRDWPKFNETEPIAGNYYPCTTGMFIKDDSTTLTVLTDASQSCSSKAPGMIDYMVHRRLLADDHRGVGEPLNETEFTTPYTQKNSGGVHLGRPLIIRGNHFVTVEPTKTAASVWRPLQDQVFSAPRLFFTSTVPQVRSESFLNGELPANLQMITSEFTKSGFLLRIAHQFGLGEDAELSKPVNFDVSSIFKDTTEITELTLNGLRPKSAEKRFEWLPDQGHPWRKNEPNGDTYTFGPLQIRTFNVKFIH